MSTYTLKIGGGPFQTFAAWGIEQATATFVNAGRDVAKLTQQLVDVGQPEDIAEDEIAIVKRDATIVFSGRILPRARSQSGQVRGDIVIVGPWMDLERRPYMQPWKRAFTSGIAATVQSTRWPAPEDAGRSVWQSGWSADGGYQLFGRVFLGADPLEWDEAHPNDNRLSTGQQITQILNYAIGKGARLQVGTIDPGILMPLDRAQDITCAMAIQRCLRWTPSSVAWVYYSTTPPTFNVTDIVPENVSARMRGGTLESHAVTLGVGDFVSESFSIQRDLRAQVKGVVLVVKLQLAKKGDQYNVGGGDGANVAIPEDDLSGIEDPVTTDFARYAYPAGTVEGAEDVVPFSMDSADLGGEEPTILVEKIYQLSQNLGWRGAGILIGQEVPDAIDLGNTLNLTGGLAVWETMAAPVQTIEDDWLNGRRRVTWGPPRALGTGDLAALLLANRSRIRPAKEHRQQQATGGSGDTWGFGEDDQDTKPGAGTEVQFKLVTEFGIKKLTFNAVSVEDVTPLPSEDSAVTVNSSGLNFTPIGECGE